MKSFWFILFVVAGVVAADSPTSGVPKSTLKITADTADFDSATRLIVFSGNVTVIDPPAKAGEPETRLRCGVLTVKVPEGGKNIESILAERNVVIVQGENRATGDRAIYHATNDVVELTGNPTLTTAHGELQRAAKVVFDRARGKLHAIGGADQVQMEIKGEAIGSTNKTLFPLPGPSKKKDEPARPSVKP
jgi:lipopolysaccharide export system protein LptA